MSTDDFNRRLSRMPDYMAALNDCTPISARAINEIPEVPAVYLLIEDSRPCYVGRSGPNQRLRKRIRNHQTSSFHAASYAYKRTCRELGLQRSYKRGSGETRAERRQNPAFLAAFERHLAAISAMQLKFVRIDDPIEQYLFELYATMALDLDLSGFETH